VVLVPHTTAAITREGEWYVAHCLQPNVTSQGETIQESLANLREALELYFEDTSTPERLPQATEALPPCLDEEQPVPGGLMALIGAVNGPEDLAERHDHYVWERFGGRRERDGLACGCSIHVGIE